MLEGPSALNLLLHLVTTGMQSLSFASVCLERKCHLESSEIIAFRGETPCPMLSVLTIQVPITLTSYLLFSRCRVRWSLESGQSKAQAEIIDMALKRYLTRLDIC